MRLISGEHHGDLQVDGYVAVSGTVRGSVHVGTGRFTLTGSVDGDVSVDAGVATLFGTVAGDVTNRAGHVVIAGEVLGVIDGDVETDALATQGRDTTVVRLATAGPETNVADGAALGSASSSPESAPGAKSLPVAPWRYDPTSRNPRQRIQRWRNFVRNLAFAFVALCILGLALYLGSQAGQLPGP